MCVSFKPIQHSEFANTFEDIFDSNFSTGPCATVNPIKEGWLHMNKIVFPLSIAVGIVEYKIAVILLIF